MYEDTFEMIEKMKVILKNEPFLLKRYLDSLTQEFQVKMNSMNFLMDFIIENIDKVDNELKQGESEKESEIEEQKWTIEPQLLESSIIIPTESDVYKNDYADLEETITSLNFDFEETYNSPFPPPQLGDPIKNKDVLDFNIVPSLLFYFRTLTHPYKQKISDSDKIYLNYLIDIEGWSNDLIQYMISDINDSFEYTGFDSESSTQASSVDYINDYIDLIKIFIVNNEERIKIEISEKVLNVRLNRKKALFQDGVKLKWFKDYMYLWGSLFIALKGDLLKKK